MKRERKGTSDTDVFTVGETTARIVFSAGLLTVAAWFDMRRRIVPNPLLLAALGVRIGLWAAEIAGGTCWSTLVFSDLAGAGLILLSLCLLYFLGKGGLGMGDIKLLSVLALFLPAATVGRMCWYGLCLAAIPSLWWLLSGRKKAKDTLPFVPFLWLGYVWLLPDMWV